MAANSQRNTGQKLSCTHTSYETLPQSIHYEERHLKLQQARFQILVTFESLVARRGIDKEAKQSSGPLWMIKQSQARSLDSKALILYESLMKKGESFAHLQLTSKKSEQDPQEQSDNALNA